jgi:hypothetical protein
MEMKSRAGWQHKVTAWAGWLLGGCLLLALAVGAMTLSTDGARLKRLFTKSDRGRAQAPAVESASFSHRGESAGVPGDGETGPPASVYSGETKTEWAPPPIEAMPGPVASSAAVSVAVPADSSMPPKRAPRSTGCVLAEVMGPSSGVEVLLDGQWKGSAPVLIEFVSPGTHRLTFQSGSVNWHEEVRVSVGDTTVVACVAPDLLSGDAAASSGTATREE